MEFDSEDITSHCEYSVVLINEHVVEGCDEKAETNRSMLGVHFLIGWFFGEERR